MNQRFFTDQMGYEVVVDFPPRRIISLVPSQTELLSDLGLDDEVVGITKFCVHPNTWRSSRQVIGGTKTPDVEAIARLRPDLIIGNKEENEQESILQLKRRFPVWMSDIVSFTDALEMIRGVGDITDRAQQAAGLIQSTTEAFSTLKPCTSASVLYLIWRKPWMAAGKGTFVDTMLGSMGLTNAIDEARYPELNDNVIRALKPGYIFLSSEPFPFGDKHIEELQKLAPDGRIMLVDGEMFSWYGSRLRHAPEYFSTLNLA